MKLFLLSFFLLPTLLCANANPHFNPKTIQRLKGEISSVQTFGNVTQPTPHKQILLRNANGEIVVDIGPEWFIDSQDINLYPGQKVEVVGSVIKLNGTPYVFAISITINGTTYKLRDHDGRPVWRRR